MEHADMHSARTAGQPRVSAQHYRAVATAAPAASRWAFFGTGLALGLIAAIMMIAAISTIYPAPSP